MDTKKSFLASVFLLFLIMNSFFCFGQEDPGMPEEPPPAEEPEPFLPGPELPAPRAAPIHPEDALPPPPRPEGPEPPEEIRELMERAREGAVPYEREPGERPPEALEPTTREIPVRYERPDYSALEQKATYIITAIIILFILVLGDIVLRIVKWIRGE